MNDAGVSCGIYMSYQGGGVDEEGDEVVIPTNQDTDKPGSDFHHDAASGSGLRGFRG